MGGIAGLGGGPFSRRKGRGEYHFFGRGERILLFRAFWGSFGSQTTKKMLKNRSIRLFGTILSSF
jgi:hypothetical protein